MDNYDLLAAIGSTDNTYLLELEQPRIRRLPKHFGLIAALIVLLLTACAAPVIVRSFDKVQTAVRSNTGNGCEVYVLVNGSRQWKYEGFHSYDAEVQVTANPDAPQSIEIQYFPVGLLDYCTPDACDVTDTSLSMNLSLKVPRYGKIYGILYHQHIIPKDGIVTVPKILGYSYLEQESRTYGEAQTLIFHGDVSYPMKQSGEQQMGDPTSGMIYTQIIFWSDGDYLYCLKLPITYNLPITAVEEIITSLTPVEDISQYLTAK